MVREFFRDLRQLRLVLDTVPSFIFYLNTDLRFQFCNQAFCDCFGLTQANVVKSHVQEILGEETFNNIKDRLLLALGGECATFEAEIPCLDNKRRYMRCTFTPDIEKENEVVGIVVSLTDITHHKHIEDALSENNAKYEAVFQAMMDGVLVFDTQGRPVLANDAQAQIIGYNSSTEVLRNLEYFAAKYELFQSDGSFVPFDQWPISRIFGGKTVNRDEFRVRRIDNGREWYLSFSGKPVYDRNGEIQLGVIVTRDISNMKQAQAVIKDSERRFRAFANSIPQLAWITDPLGSITWYNDQWYEYTGTTLEQMQTEGWTCVHHPEYTERVTQKWYNHLKSGEAWEDTFPLKSKTGEWRWFLSRANPVRDEEGNIVQWFGSNTDITEQRLAAEQLLNTQKELQLAMERAQHASATKSEFLANMSHEIRTPMNSILGFSELLMEPHVTTAERIDYVQRIRKNGTQLLLLIDDILDLSKFEAGKTPVDKVKFSVTELINDLLESLSLLAEKKGLRLSLSFTTPVPQVIHSDPHRFRQILTNIIGNAIKFSETGSIKLRLSFRRHLDRPNDGFLCLEVEDTGIGIEPEVRTKIFQPFTQADSSIARKFGGTGLGLILSQRLAKALGGDVTLKSSTPGQGSCFLVEIQTGDVSQTMFVDNSKNCTFDDDSNPAPPFKNQRLRDVNILLVEDSADNGALAQIYLRAEGAHVDVATNGLEALKMTRKSKYDIVLMDIQMPVLDGLEATKRLRSEKFKNPIIALTAHALREEIDKSLAAGCDKHLTKPIKRGDLVKAIQSLLGATNKDTSNIRK